MAKQICIQCSGRLTDHCGMYKQQDGRMWPCGACLKTGIVDEEVNFPKRFEYKPNDLMVPATKDRWTSFIPYYLGAIITSGCFAYVIHVLMAGGLK